MKLSILAPATFLVGAGVMLSGFAGGGAVKSGPANVPYRCEGGRVATAIYESGGDFRHAKVLLTFDGRTSELEAAPTLSGARYVGAGEGGVQPLAWSIRGERAWLSHVSDAGNVDDAGQPIAACTRYRGAANAAAYGEGAP